MYNQDHIFNRIWAVVYPLGIYYVVISIVMFLAQMIIGQDSAHYMLCQIIASIVTIPVIAQFYIQDSRLISAAPTEVERDATIQWKKGIVWKLLLIVVAMSMLGTSLNNLITMSPLVEWSEGYKEANQGFYGSTVGVELFGSALITPFLEEMLYRGVILSRLKKMGSEWMAIVISALVFGFMHFNMVQSTYAFLVGIVLAIITIYCGHFGFAIFAHAVANGLAIVRTEFHLGENLLNGSAASYAIASAMLVLGVGALVLLVILTKKERKSV